MMIARGMKKEKMIENNDREQTQKFRKMTETRWCHRENRAEALPTQDRVPRLWCENATDTMLEFLEA